MREDSGKPFVAKPAEVDFILGSLIEPPQIVRLKAAQPLSPAMLVAVADPTQVGVSRPVLTGHYTAKATFFPISSGKHGGETTVAITDINTPLVGVRIPVSQQPCGRPDNLVRADLIFPPIGAKVSLNVRQLYFAIYSSVAPAKAYPVNLHLIVDRWGTLEGSTLSEAAPPPRSVIPMPPPGPIVTTYMRGTIPKPPHNSMIRTQVYDDSCQLPMLAGAFRTK